jgi:D-arabinose 1-dehydrogenase-like Zn-dependent alcohol dehydrogenase
VPGLSIILAPVVLDRQWAHTEARQTQEMLDFCAEHGITADVEVLPIQQVNEALERLVRSDVRCRFVIDMTSLGSA